MNDSWYVLQAKAHHEALVEVRLADLAIEAYLPRIAATVRAGRHRQRRIMPMFPTYLFVNADLEQHGKTIRYTAGVRDFVRVGGAPQPVPPDVVATLRARIGPSGLYEPPPRRFEPGERLRIADGPLEGFDVIFECELSSAGRVAVLLAHIEFAARVVIDRLQLAAA